MAEIMGGLAVLFGYYIILVLFVHGVESVIYKLRGVNEKKETNSNA